MKTLNYNRYQGRGKPRASDYDFVPRKYTRRGTGLVLDVMEIETPTFYKRKVKEFPNWQTFLTVIILIGMVLFAMYSDQTALNAGLIH